MRLYDVAKIMQVIFIDVAAAQYVMPPQLQHATSSK